MNMMNNSSTAASVAHCTTPVSSIMTIAAVRVLYFRALSKECHVELTWNTGMVMDYIGRTHEVFEYIHTYQTNETVISYPNS